MIVALAFPLALLAYVAACYLIAVYPSGGRPSPAMRRHAILADRFGEDYAARGIALDPRGAV